MNWYNPLIVVPAAAWLAAHLIKYGLATRHGNWHFRSFYSSGGMPSAHSASVTALAVIALIEYGWESPFFGLAIVLATIVVYDSFGVRRAVGEQAAAIRALLKSGMSLRQVAGHQPLEVVAGIGLGIVVAGLARLLSG